MEEMTKHGQVGLAALRAGMDRKTARKYVKLGKLPSETNELRTWRTRPDPFAADWPALQAMLEDAPELEAKTIFEHLLDRKPGSYDPGQLRTLQRRVREWRALSGPPKTVFFAQAHVPGEAMQTDFTHAGCLGVTIGGEPFPHLLCHPVLPYSNWEWATVCVSESMAAIKRGVQAALFTLGHVPRFHQTDNSTAATHDLRTGKRGFNDEYLVLVGHFGMTPRTIQVGEKHQNGDVEALNGALKRRLEQHLLLRGSRDFESVAVYEDWVQGALAKANALREKRIREELEAMRAVSARRLPEFSEASPIVTSWSTIRVKVNTYSVPSRLIGETLRVRIYDDRLEIYFASKLQLTVERLLGENGRRIDYRHIIWSLVQKPGAFKRYRYREELFPSLVFRRAYDALCEVHTERDADIEYLRLLHLAASTIESDVEAATAMLLEEGKLRLADQVKSVIAPRKVELPELPAPAVDLSSYDYLLAGSEVAS